MVELGQTHRRLWCLPRVRLFRSMRRWPGAGAVSATPMSSGRMRESFCSRSDGYIRSAVTPTTSRVATWSAATRENKAVCCLGPNLQSRAGRQPRGARSRLRPFSGNRIVAKDRSMKSLDTLSAPSRMCRRAIQPIHFGYCNSFADLTPKNCRHPRVKRVFSDETAPARPVGIRARTTAWRSRGPLPAVPARRAGHRHIDWGNRTDRWDQSRLPWISVLSIGFFRPRI